MLKKGMLLLTFLYCASLPILANAASWTLSTRVMTVGGSMQVGTAAPQTSINGTVFKTYTTTKNVPVTLKASTGYKISEVKVNGIVQTLPLPSTTIQMGLPAFPGKASQGVTVSFAQQLVSITATATTCGVVTPSGTMTAQVGTAKSYTFTPNPGLSLVSVSGTPPGTVFMDVSATPNVAVTLPAPGNHVVNASFIVPDITIPLNISASFVGIVANAGPNQTVFTGQPATLSGTATVYDGSSVSYAWLQTGGPVSGTFANANSPTATFTSSTNGTYTLKLVATSDKGASGSATTAVTVTSSSTTAVRNQCENCHSSAGVGPGVYANWSSTMHKVKYVMCYGCHVGADTGAHPGPDPSTLGNICRNCHLDSSGNVPGHPISIGTNTCTTCHDPHRTTVAMTSAPGNVHYSNITSAMYPASYVTSRASCTDCHYDSPANLSIRQKWYTSGHARVTARPWIYYDFKTMSGCVQCHTTTGFVAYSTGRMTAAWGMASDKTKEVLTCKGCHKDIISGALRTVVPVSPFKYDSYTNPNVGKSNICMDCHSGTNNGVSIAAQLGAQADFTALPFIAPHYLAAGGTIYGKAGYHFPGRTYSAEATHSNLGSLDASGPCVSCHKNSTFGHTFQAGSIPLCANCHGSALPAAQLDADRATFANALEVLRAQLAAKGFVYAPNYPYFNNTNWGADQAGADTMGAAFNYVLLVSEPGVYAHNPAYAKQLVLDSIDYLDNGQFDDSVTTLAVPNLRGSEAISQAVADSLISYKIKDVCTTCHGGTAATTIPMATNAHPAHLTSVYGPGFYLGPDVSSCQACHIYGSATHMNGVVNLVTGAGSACQRCHAGTPPSWNPATRLACTSCHAAAPAVLPNGVAAPYKGNFASTGHGQFAASSQCTMCHDPDSRHIAGSLGSYTRLRLLNDNNLCGSCHSNASVVRSSFVNFSTHITKDGRALACIDCHDPHGTANLSMIRQKISESTITFTDNVNGFIDPVTNQGLCQVCHTATNHYRAGVPETEHPTANCLGCHAHNASGGAFKPNGACNACHGYPPAPKSPALAFGTMNNWSSARFEDYSGGGGAHLVAQHVSPNAKPSEGWTNCAVCHNGGMTSSATYHKMTLPVKDHIDNVTVLVDPKIRFSDSFIIYTGAKLVNPPARNTTGSCFNINCHMSPSPRWSIER